MQIWFGDLSLLILSYLDVRRGAQSPVDASEVFAQRAVVEFMLLNHNKDLFTNENHSKLSFYILVLQVLQMYHLTLRDFQLCNWVFRYFRVVPSKISDVFLITKGEDIYSSHIFRHLSGFKR